MNKVIHYCWFGDKPLSKLAKKCIKSWKKYLPDYKIIMWSEANVDLTECAFVREAYEKRKWAFVADYARTKALYEHGGIYLDTDVMIKKPIDFLLDNDTFLGIEDSNMVNGAVWGEKNPKSDFAKQMLNFYKSQKHFNDGDLYSISIPRIITKILMKYGFDRSAKELQILNGNIYVYPRDYFYPLSYNHKNNIFTKNTCMVHYFDASWTPKGERKAVKIYRIFGTKNGEKVINAVRFVKRNTKRVLKIILFPVAMSREEKRNRPYKLMIEKVISAISSSKSEYIVFHNPKWLGVTSATVELFNNRIPCEEINTKEDIKRVGDTILKSGIKQVIYSAMCIGWKDLAIYLKSKSKDIKVKVFWHGNNSQVSEPYGWARNVEIIELNKKGIIDVFATCKESILEFYRKQGLREFFITNTVVLKKWQADEIGRIEKPEGNGKLRVGLYAAKSDDWRKNMFTQIAAVSLLKNAVVDMVPLSNEALQFARKLDVEISGVDYSLSRNKLLKRMSQNDINLYVTFSECSPMLPLESFEVGVPCISGNNHHYYKDSKLKEYLIVSNESSPTEIAETVKRCLDNKEEVFKLYKEWKETNNTLSKESVKKFLDM